MLAVCETGYADALTVIIESIVMAKNITKIFVIFCIEQLS